MVWCSKSKGLKMKKEKCLNCGKVATWAYMPGTSHYCDEHVPRGCSCNEYEICVKIGGNDITENPIGIEGKDWKFGKTNTTYIELDGNGMEFPCCEYWHDENGWDLDEAKAD